MRYVDQPQVISNFFLGLLPLICALSVEEDSLKLEKKGAMHNP